MHDYDHRVDVSEADPAVAIPVNQASDWIDIWDASDATTRDRIRRNRGKTLTSIAKAGRKHGWKHAKGPISATINTLLDIG